MAAADLTTLGFASMPSSSFGGDGNRDKSDYLVVQAFQKVLDVVLLARVDVRHPQERLTRPQRTKFNLDVPEVGVVRELLEPWASGGSKGHALAPLVLDIVGPGAALGGDHEEVLVERWSLSYRADGASVAASSGEVKAQLRIVLKRIMILLRTLFGFLRLLPAHQFARRLPGTPTELSYSLCCAEVSPDGALRPSAGPSPLPPPQAPRAILDEVSRLAFSETPSHHAFPEIATPYGVFGVAVFYQQDLHPRSEVASGPRNISKDGVIQDYYQKAEAKGKEMSGLGRLLAEAKRPPTDSPVAQRSSLSQPQRDPNFGCYNPPTEWLPHDPKLTPPPSTRPHVYETDPHARHIRRRNTAPISVPSDLGLPGVDVQTAQAYTLAAEIAPLTKALFDDETPPTPPVLSQQASRSLDSHPGQHMPPPNARGLLQGASPHRSLTQRDRGSRPLVHPVRSGGRAIPAPHGAPPIPHPPRDRQSPSTPSPMGGRPPFLCGTSPPHATGASPTLIACSPPYRIDGADFHPSLHPSGASPMAMVAYESSNAHPPSAPSFLPSKCHVAPLPAVVEGGLSSMLLNPFLLEHNPIQLEESMASICPVTDDRPAPAAPPLALPFSHPDLAPDLEGRTPPDADTWGESSRLGATLPVAPVLSSLGGEAEGEVDLDDYRRFLHQVWEG